MAKTKSSDNDQKRILVGLSLKGREKDHDASPASSDPRQTVLVPSASPQGLQILVQKQKLGAKRAKEEKAKGVGSEIEVSSRPSMGDDEDMEILEELMLTRKAKKPRTASSKSSQNLAACAGEGMEGDKEMEPKNSEGPDYNQLGNDLRSENQKLRLEVDELGGENLKLKSETEEVKAGVEEFINQFEFTSDYENLQDFFVNFGAQHVLTEVKALYPKLDLFAIEAIYPAPEEAEDRTDLPPNDEDGMNPPLFG
ncbi:hypothetical protein Fot_37432 [Forsythia ovata]|uniref:Uncharacterized protein n=1 Tax=Forsythia ovata TaxID=205694 RepID=A0ABD1RZ00_9LAMI